MKITAASSKLDFYNEYGQSIVQLPLSQTFFICRRNVLAEPLHCFWNRVQCYFQPSYEVNQILYLNFIKLQLNLGKFQTEVQIPQQVSEATLLPGDRQGIEMSLCKKLPAECEDLQLICIDNSRN